MELWYQHILNKYGSYFLRGRWLCLSCFEFLLKLFWLPSEKRSTLNFLWVQILSFYSRLFSEGTWCAGNQSGSHKSYFPCQQWQKFYQLPGPSCSKLTMSLVNDLLKFTLNDTQICWNFLLKKCKQLLQCKSYSHFFSKYIIILYIESAKTVNEMTLNKLVKLTMLWTTWPRCIKSPWGVQTFRVNTVIITWLIICHYIWSYMLILKFEIFYMANRSYV